MHCQQKSTNTCCQVHNFGYLHDILESSEHKNIGGVNISEVVVIFMLLFSTPKVYV